MQGLVQSVGQHIAGVGVPGTGIIYQVGNERLACILFPLLVVVIVVIAVVRATALAVGVVEVAVRLLDVGQCRWPRVDPRRQECDTRPAVGQMGPHACVAHDQPPVRVGPMRWTDVGQSYTIEDIAGLEPCQFNALLGRQQALASPMAKGDEHRLLCLDVQDGVRHCLVKQDVVAVAVVVFGTAVVDAVLSVVVDVAVAVITVAVGLAFNAIDSIIAIIDDFDLHHMLVAIVFHCVMVSLVWMRRSWSVGRRRRPKK